MPTSADQLPRRPDWFARELRRISDELRSIRAAPRSSSTTISGGTGITLEAAGGGPTIGLTAAPGTIQGRALSTALVISTGLDDEVAPGYVALYLADAGTPGVTPGLAVVTPDVGQGVATMLLYPGSPDGTFPPAAYMSAGDTAEFTLVDDDFELSVSGGACHYDGNAFRPVLTGAWAALPLANSWTAYGSGFQGPEYTRDICGMVCLDGQIAPGVKTAGTTVGTLPPGYLPAGGDRTYRVSAGAAGASADIIVRSSGAVQIQTSTGTVTWLSLSGIRFPAATP